MPEKYYSLREAVALLGITVRTARGWIKDGKMKAIKYEDVAQGLWYVPESEILRLQGGK